MPVLSTITNAAAVTMDALRRLLTTARDAVGAFREWLEYYFIQPTKAAALQILRELQDLLYPTEPVLLLVYEEDEQDKNQCDSSATTVCEIARAITAPGATKCEVAYQSDTESSTETESAAEIDDSAEGEEEEDGEDEQVEEANGQDATEEEEDDEDEEEDATSVVIYATAASNAAMAKMVEKNEAMQTVARQCVVALSARVKNAEAVITEWLTTVGVAFTVKDVCPCHKCASYMRTEMGYGPWVFVENAHDGGQRQFVALDSLKGIAGVLANRKLKDSAVSRKREQYVDAELAARMVFMGVAKRDAKEHEEEDDA